MKKKKKNANIDDLKKQIHEGIVCIRFVHFSCYEMLQRVVQNTDL